MESIIKKVKFVAMSPWLVVALVALPALTIALILNGMPTPPVWLIGLNNLLLTVLLVFRLTYYLKRLPLRIRYGSAAWSGRRTTVSLPVPLKAGDLLSELKDRGYAEADNGWYLESRDSGFIWTTVAHFCFLVVILLGSYDYMTYISGEIKQGIGHPTPLYNAASYGEFRTGPFASQEDLPYKIKVLEQKRPTTKSPYGGATLSIQDKNGEEILREDMAPGERVAHKGFYVEFLGTEYFVWMVLLDSKNHSIFANWISFYPGPATGSKYFYQGRYDDKYRESMVDAQMNPETRDLIVSAEWKGKNILDKVEVLLSDLKYDITIEGIRIKIPGIATNSVFRIERKRHFEMIKALSLLSLISLILSFAIKSRRVWIEEKDGVLHIEATRPAEVLKAAGRAR